MAKIVIIDDDMNMDLLGENLHYRGHNLSRLDSAAKAFKNMKRINASDLVILDIIMPWPKGKMKSGTAGMEVLRSIRKENKKIPILVYSATQDQGIIDAIKGNKNVTFIPKWDGPSIRELVHIIYKILKIEAHPPLIPFIVHGRNDKRKLEVKNYLQNTLKLQEPIILHEKPNLGRSVIEKFEDYAMMSSLVFVLLTPDDRGALAKDSDDLKRRARQNVIFEMGYFLGLLGRTGRVILLYEGEVELPSDITGLVYINISNGIESVGEELRREISNVRKQNDF